MMVLWDELPKSPGHAFYDRLHAVLVEAGSIAWSRPLCQPVGAGTMDALEVHEQVFAWVLERLSEYGLIKGRRVGVDASTMEANAAVTSIRRRDTGESYREMLTRMAEASGVDTPTAAELKQFDRRRRARRTANAEWASRSDPEAMITRIKDGDTRLAYKPQHAVDLDTGAVVAAEVHPDDEGDTTTLEAPLRAAVQGWKRVGVPARGVGVSRAQGDGRGPGSRNGRHCR
jgi:hypothetical protein